MEHERLQRSVLIVSADTDERHRWSMLLDGHADLEIDEASSAHEAIDILGPGHRIMAVVVDAVLPNGDCTSVLDHCSELAVAGRPAVVVVGGLDDFNRVAEAVRGGADDQVNKHDIENLAAVVERAARYAALRADLGAMEGQLALLVRTLDHVDEIVAVVDADDWTVMVANSTARRVIGPLPADRDAGTWFSGPEWAPLGDVFTATDTRSAAFDVYDGTNQLECRARRITEDGRPLVIVRAREAPADALRPQPDEGRDPLTGLVSRRPAERAIVEAVATPAASTWLIGCDIVGFRTFNERHGFEMGNTLLVAVAARIRSAVRGTSAGDRPDDFVARHGADEFLVLTDADGVDPVVRRLRHRLAQPVHLSGLDIRVDVRVEATELRADDTVVGALDRVALADEPTPSDGGPGRPAPITVMTVDDDPSALDLLRAVLEFADVEVVAQASGAASALRQFEALDDPPRVVVIDLNLGGEDGVDVARRILERHPDQRILLCSGQLTPAARNRGRDAGVSAFADKYRSDLGNLIRGISD